MEIKLPPGFPVKVDIPVLPTVSARVTFHDFAWKNTKTNPRSAAMAKADLANGLGGETAAATSNGNKGENSCSDDSENGGETGARRKSRSLKGVDDDPEEDDDALLDGLFDIPKDYVEDNNRFPDL